MIGCYCCVVVRSCDRFGGSGSKFFVLLGLALSESQYMRRVHVVSHREIRSMEIQKNCQNFGRAAAKASAVVLHAFVRCFGAAPFFHESMLRVVASSFVHKESFSTNNSIRFIILFH